MKKEKNKFKSCLKKKNHFIIVVPEFLGVTLNVNKRMCTRAVTVFKSMRLLVVQSHHVLALPP